MGADTGRPQQGVPCGNTPSIPLAPAGTAPETPASPRVQETPLDEAAVTGLEPSLSTPVGRTSHPTASSPPWPPLPSHPPSTLQGCWARN